MAFGSVAKCGNPSDVVVVGNGKGGNTDLDSFRDDGLGVRARIPLGFLATKRTAIMMWVHLQRTTVKHCTRGSGSVHVPPS